MERERSNIANEEELKHAGRQAADALRGYGYSDFAQQYEQALQRSALAPKEVLTHSRIANTTLQELNTLQAERHTNHPAVERNIQIQEQLEAALQKQQESSVQKTKSIGELSFPAKMYLEENSKPLESAAQEVTNYLDEKRAYSHSVEGKTKLHREHPAAKCTGRTATILSFAAHLSQHRQSGTLHQAGHPGDA